MLGADVGPIRLERWPTFDDTASGRSNRPSLVAPICITGQLTKEQPKYQADITLNKGKKQVVQVISQSMGLQVDPILTIQHIAGKELHKAETGALNTDLTTSFTPPQDGLYTFHVSDLHSRQGHRMAFLLRVVPEEPDFAISVDTDRFNLAPGKPLDVPVRITSLAGFKDPVQLNVEGLPPAVQWKVIPTPGPPEKTADKNVITLRIESKEPVSTGFQIIGISSTNKKMAQAGLPDFGITTSNLWLTANVSK